MSLDLFGAEEKAREYIDAIASAAEVSCVIVRDKIREEPDGWYLPYQSQEFLTSGDINKSLVGNWSIFVSRDGQYVGPRRPGMPLPQREFRKGG